METKTMMDMARIRSVEHMEAGLVSSDKGNVESPLKPRKKTMTSPYLGFFETAPDGKSRRCKFCKQSYSIATATGNLGRHLNHRHPGYDRHGDTGPQVLQGAVTSKKPQFQVKPATLDFNNLNWLLLKCLIGASLTPSAFEDEALLNTFKFLNPSVKIWPKEKVEAITLEVFKSMQQDVRTSLEHVNSKVSLTLDFWTSYEHLFYMSVKCHWIDDNWSLHKVLLDVCHIPYPCTGSEIFHALKKILSIFNIDNKTISCTSDNNNSQHAIDACLQLKEEFDSRKVPFCYIPCAGRILNLLIEDGLRTVKPILFKIREFVLELNSHPEIAQDFKQLSSSYQEGSWKLPLDTSATWNADYMMLEIVTKASNSMDSIIKKHEETFGSRNLLLSTTEKSIVSTLYLYLEPFHKLTTNLCSCKVPPVGLVLFFMDHIFEMISPCRDNSRQEWLKSVADDMAKRARSFSSQVYNLFTFMAAVLDPRIKKELIPDSLNSEKNLEEARSHFTRHYATNQFPALTSSYGAQHGEDEDVSFAEEIARKRRHVSMNVATDELSQYLSEPPAPMATDILEWWKLNSTRYPRLAVMARDYLAIQGTSVEPNDLFSSRGDETHKQKFCLPYRSMKAVMCIKSWIHSGYKFKFRSTEIDFEKLMDSGVAALDNVKS